MGLTPATAGPFGETIAEEAPLPQATCVPVNLGGGFFASRYVSMCLPFFFPDGMNGVQLAHGRGQGELWVGSFNMAGGGWGNLG